jgi:hypothetical protein
LSAPTKRSLDSNPGTDGNTSAITASFLAAEVDFGSGTAATLCLHPDTIEAAMQTQTQINRDIRMS